MVTVYGISNCGTIRKTRKWLDAHDVEYRFHDFRKDGLAPELLTAWVDKLGWEVLLNKRGMTWRKLSDDEKADIDAAKAIALMLKYPAMIKRPVIDTGDGLIVGFNEQEINEALGARGNPA